MPALTTHLVGWLLVSPVVAPVPAATPPDPLTRPALGILAQGDGLVIGEAYAHMPAAKAGIRAGDRIVRVGRLQPQAFQQVIDEISSYRPGAVVEVEVDRAGTKKVFKVKLVPRPSEFDNRGRLPFNPDD